MSNTSSLKLNSINWTGSEDGSFKCAELSYCAGNDIPEEIASRFQIMKIYVPSAYLNEDGSINRDTVICGYSALTAPVIFKNNCVGWNSSIPRDVNEAWIKRGWVQVECGARSRNADPDNIWSKSPCQVVDLKSGIRMLRLNSALIPGDTEKIISYGFSGGGQMSSMVGATGNMEAYFELLWENGAAGIEKDPDGTFKSTIRDDVYGCMCFCPIASLQAASAAVSWIRFDSEGNGQNEFSEFQKALEKDMAVAYCEYINSLDLKDENGIKLGFDTDPITGKTDPRKGSYYERTMANISDAFNCFYEAREQMFPFRVRKGMGPRAQFTEYATLEEFMGRYQMAVQKEDGTVYEWLKQDENGRFVIADPAGLFKGTRDFRQKGVPAFDDMTSPEKTENSAFGRPGQKAVHYSAMVAELLRDNYDRYSAMEGFEEETVRNFIDEALDEQLKEQLYLMDSTAILLDIAHGNVHGDIAKKWRVRMGTDDQSSFAVPFNFSMAARMAGAEADYHLVWAMGHGIREGISTGTFEDWVDTDLR